jgi:hypothetical protein
MSLKRWGGNPQVAASSIALAASDMLALLVSFNLARTRLG